jgi:hypothetical protein
MFENDRNELNFISKVELLKSWISSTGDMAKDQDIMPIEKPIKGNRPTNYSFTR